MVSNLVQYEVAFICLPFVSRLWLSGCKSLPECLGPYARHQWLTVPLTAVEVRLKLCAKEFVSNIRTDIGNRGGVRLNQRNPRLLGNEATATRDLTVETAAHSKIGGQSVHDILPPQSHMQLTMILASLMVALSRPSSRNAKIKYLFYSSFFVPVGTTGIYVLLFIPAMRYAIALRLYTCLSVRPVSVSQEKTHPMYRVCSHVSLAPARVDAKSEARVPKWATASHSGI
jgi:hypothetical protein